MKKTVDFVLKDKFKYDEEFDLYLLTLIQALDDLVISNKYRINQIPSSHDQDYLYFYKLSCGHLREAIKLIDSFWTKYKTQLSKTEGIMEKFNELDNLVGGFKEKNSYWYNVLKVARDNVIFHYDGEENRNMYKDRLKETSNTERFEYSYGETNGDIKYDFIEMLQYSSIITLSEKYHDLTQIPFEEKLHEIEIHFSKTMASAMYFLKYIIDFYFTQKIK